VLPLTHIRGRSPARRLRIVDEAQSLERGVLLTVLSRIGSGPGWCSPTTSAQAGQLRVAGTIGVIAVIEKLKGTRCSPTPRWSGPDGPRSPPVTEMLEDPASKPAL